MDKRPIGVFDSGLGGLTVVKELLTVLPFENIVYFGDTARIPYGTRSHEIVTRYSAQCIRFLLTKGIKMVVIACNTASSASLQALTKEFDIPITGVVEPGAGEAAAATRNGHIGVIGTAGTIRTQAYKKAIEARNRELIVVEEACPLFVPLVEEGWSDTDIAALTAARYLKSMQSAKVDTLVLGCTHYPLLTQTIARVMGPEVSLINPAVATALQVSSILKAGALENGRGDTVPQHSFYVSDFGQKFKTIGSSFLRQDISHAERVDIEAF